MVLDDNLAKVIDIDTAKVASSSSSSGSSDDRKISNSVIELAVARDFAENSLSTLRMNGFKREDIYRMLDKGPWVLAFNIPSCLPRLCKALQEDLQLNQTQIVHIVSHCPYLIAQYARYKGRDVSTTVRALHEVGCPKKTFVADVMRFPSMLATPPDRIRGWMSLLNGFGIAPTPALFGKMLKKAPFMFYINPPELFDDEQHDRPPDDDVSATASGFVVYESLRVLQLLRALDLPDLDKIVRTQPTILLQDSAKVNRRVSFLFNLCLDSYPAAAGYLGRNSAINSVATATITPHSAAIAATAAVAAAAAGAVGAAVSSSVAALQASGVGGLTSERTSSSPPSSSSSSPPGAESIRGSTDDILEPIESLQLSGKDAPQPQRRSYAISRPFWRRSAVASSGERDTATAALKEKQPSPKADFAAASRTPAVALTEEFGLRSGDEVAINVATKDSTTSQAGRQTQLEQPVGKLSDGDGKVNQSESVVSEGTLSDAATLAAIEASQTKAQQALGSLLLTYPAILSIEYQ